MAKGLVMELMTSLKGWLLKQISKVHTTVILLMLEKCEWADKHFEGIHVEFCNNDEYKVEEALFSEIFNNSVTIEGTHQIHTVIPVPKTEVMSKLFSNSEDINIVPVFKTRNKMHETCMIFRTNS